MKILWVLPLVSTLVSCVPSSTKSTSSGAASASAPYLWSDKNFPKTLQISNAFGAPETQNFQDMSTAWKTALEDKVTFFSYGATTPELTNTSVSLDSLRDSVLGIYKTTVWPASLSGTALAVTQIFGMRYNVGESDEFVNIIHADILINYNYYTFDTANTGAGFDLRTVVLHEMGHFLGLQHKDSSSNRNASVMYPSIDASEAKRAPYAIDISDMASKYGITLSSGGGHISTGTSPVYQVKEGDVGTEEKLQIELHAHGECIHRLNGEIISRHPADLRKKH